MGTHIEELRTIENDQINMARFFKVAFHCHSPMSNDWGARKDIDKTLNNKSNFIPEGKEGEFLKLILQQSKYDIVCITDHMKCGYAERLAKHVSASKQTVILPGMEVNFHTNPALGNVRLHIIVLLPPECTKETFSKFLPGVPEEAERKETDMVEGQDLRTWVKKVHELGGLCIAAHVESANGIRCCFRQTARSVMELFPMNAASLQQQQKEINRELRDLILDAGFDAIEVQKPDDRHYYRWESNEKHRIATILGLDAHCIEDYGRDEQVTLVKMTQPSINDLRIALTLPETRIRFRSDIKEPPSPRVIGMTIRGSEDSFFENFESGFSENLNCIIGPRGSGKSTLVEAMRYVFGYNRTLSELDLENKLSDRVKSLQKANLSGSLIRLYYRRKDGDTRVLEATYDAKQDYTTKVFDSDGKGVPVDDVERSGDYPLRLYGWSEIETLGRDQSRQRALLDRMIVNIKEATDRRDSLRQQMRDYREKVRRKISEIKQTLDKNQGEIYRFSEYKRDFDELNQKGIKGSFEEIDLLEAKKNIYSIVGSNVLRLVEKLKVLEPINLGSGVEKVIKKFGSELEQWWQQEQIREKEIVGAEQFIAEEIGKIKQRLEQLRQSLLLKENTFGQYIDQAYGKLRGVLSGEPDKQRIADLRQNAKNRLDRVSAIREEYMEHWRGLRSLINERRGVGKQLTSAQNEVTGIRATMIDMVQKKLNEFMREGLKISIKMLPGRDRGEFSERLKEFLKSPGRRVSSRLLGSIPESYTPVDFTNLLLERRWDDLTGKSNTKVEETEITQDDVEKLRETKDWYEHSEEADVDRLIEDGKRLLEILELGEVCWDDKEVILLNDQPVDKLSPGQRSSAMLPLIALAENSPLVIDQPEDNLDNRLVGNVLVDILAQLKEHRQIIVCTHNPNIVVSGDAEQVIALEAESNRKGRLEGAGSVDNPDIVNTVIELMEGGREAFRVRKERYGI